MPPLICASPIILDQSFPRNKNELNIIAISLGELQDYIEKDKIHLILTAGLRDLIDEFDWNPSRPYPLLNEIYRLITHWFLQPNNRLVEINVEHVKKHEPHPVPIGTENEGLVDFWADELGKILTLHDEYSTRNEFFIGVACEPAFANNDTCQYDIQNDSRVFPLVGPDTLDQLNDAYKWDIPPNIRQKSVSFNDALKNVSILGATAIDSPSGGSHYKVKFEGERPWTLDPNVDPVPDRFLRELTCITHYPLLVIKTALINGCIPEKRLRFDFPNS